MCCSRATCCHAAVNRGFVREPCSLDTQPTGTVRPQNPRMPPLTGHALCGAQRIRLSQSFVPPNASRFQGLHGLRSLPQELPHDRCRAACPLRSPRLPWPVPVRSPAYMVCGVPPFSSRFACEHNACAPTPATQQMHSYGPSSLPSSHTRSTFIQAEFVYIDYIAAERFRPDFGTSQHPHVHTCDCRCTAADASYSWGLALPLASVGFWGEITSNVIFMAGFWGWLTAQVAKIFTCYFKKGVWDITQVVSAGGMPSSHSSLCMVRFFQSAAVLVCP